VKDQYVGDVNDYLKYALLRSVARTAELVVAWMLTTSDGRTDGQRLNYLQRPGVFRDLDPALFDLLEELVRSNQRTVAAVEASGVLGVAAYLSDGLEDDPRARNSYFDRLSRLAGERRTVFFDPDNGLEVSSVLRGRRSSSKYLYWEEAAATFREGRSIVVYQHFPRRPRQTFLEAAVVRARTELGCETVLAFTTSHTAFLIVPQPIDAEEMSRRVVEFSRRAATLGTAFTLLGERP
jgi:hypothetical protein